MRDLTPWRQILADALAEEPVIEVNAQVRRQVGRDPTRSELSAARRAANRYAAQGHAQTALVASSEPDQPGLFLVLARPGIEIPGERPEPPRYRPAPPAGPRRPPRSQIQNLRAVAKGLHGAARTARQSDVTLLEPPDAAGLAADLRESLAELNRLRVRLERHGRVNKMPDQSGF